MSDSRIGRVEEGRRVHRTNLYETIIFDPKGTLGFDLGVYGAPETFVIDAEGVVRYRHVGVVNQKVWDEVLLPVIAQARGNS